MSVAVETWLWHDKAAIQTGRENPGAAAFQSKMTTTIGCLIRPSSYVKLRQATGELGDCDSGGWKPYKTSLFTPFATRFVTWLTFTSAVPQCSSIWEPWRNGGVCEFRSPKICEKRSLFDGQVPFVAWSKVSYGLHLFWAAWNHFQYQAGPRLLGPQFLFDMHRCWLHLRSTIVLNLMKGYALELLFASGGWQVDQCGMCSYALDKRKKQ